MSARIMSPAEARRVMAEQIRQLARDVESGLLRSVSIEHNIFGSTIRFDSPMVFREKTKTKSKRVTKKGRSKT